MNQGKSRVVRIRAKNAGNGLPAASPAVLLQMLEAGLLLLTGCKDPAAAWARYFRPKDTIGIKVNCLGGRHICSHPALAEATVKSLEKIGIAPHQVIVWDRSNRELKRCGFPLNIREKGTYRCFGTDQRGAGYEQELTVQGSVGSLFSTLLTRHCSAMINMPVLKDHGLCGLTGALKNIFGALHNPNKYHEDGCDPFIADANAVPFARRKHRLVICDALTVQFKGGPGFHPQWAKPLGSILLAEDMVALDSVGAGILNQLRAEHHLSPIVEGSDLPAYLKTAADPDHRLGHYRASEIELIEKIV